MNDPHVHPHAHSPTHTHIDSVGTYLKVLVALLVCTGLTTWVAYIDLGAWSTVVALSIASLKMILVALFFMHVRHSTRLTKVVVVGALMWLGILLFLTMTDFVTRNM
jgi:cytochrome c oxidase subunit 4